MKPLDEEPVEWYTKLRPDYSAHPMAKYLIMIKAPDDPPRRPRPVGGQEDRFPHHTLNKMTESQIAKVVLDLLSDGVGRTLNRIGVELWDKEGSIVGGTKVEDVLWQLTLDGVLAFTKQTPILFRDISKGDSRVSPRSVDSSPPRPASRSTSNSTRRTSSPAPSPPSPSSTRPTASPRSSRVDLRKAMTRRTSASKR